jgi:Family of unknown function (DUF6496)
MPEQEVIDRAKRDEQEGKSPSTQAGEFVREEMHRVREGKHGAANTKQAIAIGLSKARRAGVKLPQPSAAPTSAETRKQANATPKKAKREIQLRPERARERSPKRSNAKAIRRRRPQIFRVRPKVLRASAARRRAKLPPNAPLPPKDLQV